MFFYCGRKASKNVVIYFSFIEISVKFNTLVYLKCFPPSEKITFLKVITLPCVVFRQSVIYISECFKQFISLFLNNLTLFYCNP